MNVVLIENLLLGMTLFFLVIYSFIIFFVSFKRMHYILYLAIICHIILIVHRTLTVKHAPFASIYESLIFFSLLYELKIVFSNLHKKDIGALLFIPSIIVLLFALLLPYKFKSPEQLMPTLRSLWMLVHVPSVFMGYVSLIFAFFLAMVDFFSKRYVEEMIDGEIKLGFFFITLGIMTGCICAEQNWGVFWNWDPKEVWALMIWLIIAVYFHVTKKTYKYLIISTAFLFMFFTYFGIMFFLPSLHSFF
jgi:ABC-type transport system involved in cytochrome c biogenesis permease subunit